MGSGRYLIALNVDGSVIKCLLGGGNTSLKGEFALGALGTILDIG
jgi:hypothetical protein